MSSWLLEKETEKGYGEERRPSASCPVLIFFLVAIITEILLTETQ